MRNLFCAVFLFFVAGCTSNNIEKSTIILDSPNSIFFKGSTSMANADEFEALLLAQSPFITSLTVNSGGGDVLGGMKIGHLVHKYNLNVIVEDFCASSCANYIVTAANDIFVKQNSTLGWHGGATQNLYYPFKDNTSWLIKIFNFFSGIDEEQAWNEFFSDFQRQEMSFFQKVNVKQAITIIGMMPEYIEKRDASLFSYDIDTLRRLGLNIEFENTTQSQSINHSNKAVQIFTITEDQLKKLLEKHQQTLMAVYL